MSQTQTRRSSQVDLLHGPILKSLLLFALPIMASRVFQQIYNTMDTLIVGYTLGDSSIAAMGACSSIYEMMTGFTFGVGNGLAIVTARCFGRQETDRMKKSVASCIVIGVAVTLVVTILAFVLSNASAGDVATVTLQSRGMQITEESLAAIREELGLNAPIYLQYWNWLKNAVRFDFGNSFQTGRPVSEEILSRFPATLELALVATLISLLMSIPLAVLSARYKGSAFDHGIRAVSSISATMPDFWLGLMLLYFFAVELKIAPVVSGSSMKNIFLPAFTLSVANTAVYTRVLRGNLLEASSGDYILAARARGLGKSAALVKHGLKNSMLPMVTLIGVNFGKMLSGQVAVETIFSWNGIGQFAISCMKQKDLPVIQGYIIVVSVTYILINLILDIIYVFIDPRIASE